jgi:hypothetical protein
LGARHVVTSLEVEFDVVQFASVYIVTPVLHGIVVEPHVHGEHDRVSLTVVNTTDRSEYGPVGHGTSPLVLAMQSFCPKPASGRGLQTLPATHVPAASGGGWQASTFVVQVAGGTVGVCADGVQLPGISERILKSRFGWKQVPPHRASLPALQLIAGLPPTT